MVLVIVMILFGVVIRHKRMKSQSWVMCKCHGCIFWKKSITNYLKLCMCFFQLSQPMGTSHCSPDSQYSSTHSEGQRKQNIDLSLQLSFDNDHDDSESLLSTNKQGCVPAILRLSEAGDQSGVDPTGKNVIAHN